jgi:hypothetical protein
MKKLIIAAAVFLPLACHGAFFDMGECARPAGMGEAFVAVADDPSAMYYNVAGLTQLKMISGNATYSAYTAGISDSFVAVGVPLYKYGSVGVSWLNTAVDIYSENTVALGYAYNVDKKNTVGIKAKYMSKSYGTNQWTAANPVFSKTSAAGISVDLGLLSRLTDDLTVGVQLENLNAPDISLVTPDIVNRNYRAGLKYKIESKWIAAFEADYNDLDIKAKVGSEYWVDTKFLDSLGISNAEVGFRGGIGYGTNSYMNVSAGFSFYFPMKVLDIRFDYSFTLPFNYVDGAATHRFTINVTEPRPAFNI